MPARAGKRNFTAERGSTFDHTLTWNALVQVSENFTGDGTTKILTLDHEPAEVADNEFLCRVHINGREITAFTVQGDKVYLGSTPSTGAAILVEYSYSDPVVLTGYTARMQVRESAGSAVLADLTTENGSITLTSPGEIRLLVEESITKTWEPGTYLYDLELDQSGYVTRLIEGKFKIVANITEET